MTDAQNIDIRTELFGERHGVPSPEDRGSGGAEGFLAFWLL